MKNKIFILVFAFILPFMATAQPPSSAYSLVHSDDFNDNATNIGDDIDAGLPLDNGNVTGTCSWPIKENVDISNGTLNASVKRQDVAHPNNPNAGTRNFSAGDWHTFITFRYGYFEAKIKVTQLDHVWGAFWLLKLPGVGPYQEIDIMEFFTASGNGNDGYLSCSQHWWQDQGPNANNHHTWSTDWSETNNSHCRQIDLSVYHTYGCEWTPTHIRFYLDGELWCTMENYDLHDPMHIKIGMGRQKEKNGNCGNSDETSKMVVDYLKVWQIPGSVPDGLYTKADADCTVGLNSLMAIGSAQTNYNWGNMLHMAWYPQATYTVNVSSPNMSVSQIGYPLSDKPCPACPTWNCRGEITKGFLYQCNVPGTYQVSIHISFPPGYGYAQDKTFTVIIGEVNFYAHHLVMSCFGLDFVTSLSSDFPMDSYEISQDNGVSWSTTYSYEDLGYSFLTRGHLNGHIMTQLRTYHSQQIENYCGQFLKTYSSDAKKQKIDYSKINKMIQEQESANIDKPNTSNVTTQTKLENYRTLIYNVSGQLIKTCETSQAQVRDFLTEFSSGMYFAHQFDKNGKKMATFKVSWVK
jgi:beta-glucanase (GH16 family)